MVAIKNADTLADEQHLVRSFRQGTGPDAFVRRRNLAQRRGITVDCVDDTAGSEQVSEGECKRPCTTLLLASAECPRPY